MEVLEYKAPQGLSAKWRTKSEREGKECQLEGLT